MLHGSPLVTGDMIAMSSDKICCRFSRLTYMQYKKLPAKLQEEYLDWSQAQWEEQWAQLQFERQGGVSGMARKKAEEQVQWLERVTTWSYLHAYTSRIKLRKSEVVPSTYN
ncbi:(ZYRO0G11176g) [Zygosaccharomyces parabailii]|uniref:BN860_07602g1_1 n=1 Tax=Zygosaccharomyces bailii (strain CLIB 213 / ATCC 58445 / CBS 680 / BCRC 21525 / NBRC 1098 / NCYC 1416 / NRRL Y-2227) TaxID=1333698 RepID=A0A8J2T2J2_ZYGB2|nr:(ZYRO0G11176g) [Zygosaccharomyces parabailii]CDF87492.1 BN860_07602g1_1 [Zygosaccharomyces bailii CLIB 213]CDH09360.1 uncharacterized protein ZBAI_01144 [Zygosaccharomyces bailii ISA1307]SJM87697.1 uncharacterized protein ZBIST_3886 [Zygosaccharomyces bailii]